MRELLEEFAPFEIQDMCELLEEFDVVLSCSLRMRELLEEFVTRNV